RRGSRCANATYSPPLSILGLRPPGTRLGNAKDIAQPPARVKGNDAGESPGDPPHPELVSGADGEAGREVDLQELLALDLAAFLVPQMGDDPPSPGVDHLARRG